MRRMGLHEYTHSPGRHVGYEARRSEVAVSDVLAEAKRYGFDRGGKWGSRMMEMYIWSMEGQYGPYEDATIIVSSEDGKFVWNVETDSKRK